MLTLGSSKEGSAHKGYGLAIWVAFAACCPAPASAT